MAQASEGPFPKIKVQQDCSISDYGALHNNCQGILCNAADNEKPHMFVARPCACGRRAGGVEFAHGLGILKGAAARPFRVFKSDEPGFGKGGTGVLKVDDNEVANQKIPPQFHFS
jgi:hypothetical protein